MNSLTNRILKRYGLKSERTDLSLVDDIQDLQRLFENKIDAIWSATEELNPAMPTEMNRIYEVIGGYVNGAVSNIEIAIEEAQQTFEQLKEMEDEFIQKANELGVDSNLINTQVTQSEDLSDAVSYGENYVKTALRVKDAIESEISNFEV
jgi:ABC-type transporter Mla subunit MlaD